jgi:hypothetical protein
MSWNKLTHFGTVTMCFAFTLIALKIQHLLHIHVNQSSLLISSTVRFEAAGEAPYPSVNHHAMPATQVANIVTNWKSKASLGARCRNIAHSLYWFVLVPSASKSVSLLWTATPLPVLPHCVCWVLNGAVSLPPVSCEHMQYPVTCSGRSHTGSQTRSHRSGPVTARTGSLVWP